MDILLKVALVVTLLLAAKDSILDGLERFIIHGH